MKHETPKNETPKKVTQKNETQTNPLKTRKIKHPMDSRTHLKALARWGSTR